MRGVPAAAAWFCAILHGWEMERGRERERGRGGEGGRGREREREGEGERERERERKKGNACQAWIVIVRQLGSQIDAVGESRNFRFIRQLILKREIVRKNTLF
jgi:hypothetical protein